jgi:hypothetical protein
MGQAIHDQRTQSTYLFGAVFGCGLSYRAAADM